MRVISILLLILGTLMTLEGGFFSFFPKLGSRFTKKFVKKKDSIKKVARFEMILGLILLVIGIKLL